MSLVSPKAAMAKNALAERAKGGKVGEDGENATGGEEQRDLPYEEYMDFLGTYEDSKWWLDKDKAKDDDATKDTTDPLNKHAISDAISEKDEDDAKSDNMSQANSNMDSPKFSTSSAGNKFNSSDDNEEEEKDEFPSLDDALAQDFNINEISSLKQRFSDLNR
jgi:hypothetical protein